MFPGEKIQLTAIQREYLPKYVEWLNDWESRNFCAGIPLLRIEDEVDWFERMRLHPATDLRDRDLATTS
jgi:hypothetical protein